jgi:hypothetical protein
MMLLPLPTLLLAAVPQYRYDYSRLRPAAAPLAAGSTANITADQAAWVHGVARGDHRGTPFPPMSSAQHQGVDAAGERWWSNFLEHHVAYNMSVEVSYTDRARTTLVSFGDCGDSALWTGSFLAAAAHRFNVTKERQVLEHIKALVGVYENLTRVSGKLGFMGRFMGATDDPVYARDFNSSGCAFGTNAQRAKNKCWSFLGSAPFKEYTYEDHVSRDAYFGAALGLGSTFALVGDEQTRERAAVVLRQMVADLHQSGWWIESPHYRGQFGLGNPTAGLIAVYQRIGLSVDPQRWAPVFGPDAPAVAGGCRLKSWLDFRTNCTYPEAVTLAETGDPDPECCMGDFNVPGLKNGVWVDDYFPANLGINMLYTTVLLETEPAMKARLMQVSHLRANVRPEPYITCAQLVLAGALTLGRFVRIWSGGLRWDKRTCRAPLRRSTSRLTLTQAAAEPLPWRVWPTALCRHCCLTWRLWVQAGSGSVRSTARRTAALYRTSLRLCVTRSRASLWQSTPCCRACAR